MKNLSFIAIALLSVYSTVLIFLEIRVSQPFVRNFFTDIEGPVTFYAVNTSLSVFLQLAIALMFAASLVCIEGDDLCKTERYFYRSQILLFGFMACDDRFLFHEKIGARLGIEDAFVLFFFGLLEVAVLLTWGNFIHRCASQQAYILAAAACFALMIVIDGFLPREIVPRLSLEDLSKTWAVTLLFLCSWDIYRQHIIALKRQIERERHRNLDL